MIRTPVIRALILCVMATALLAGCVTSDYATRQGARGDYYYGQPTTEYRYQGYGGYYGGYSPYGYSPYGNFHRRHGYPYGYGGYGYPYGYGGGYYRTPYRPYYPHHPHPPVGVRPPNDDRPPHDADNDRRPPWRDLDGVRRRHAGTDGLDQRVEPARPVLQQPAPNMQAPRPESQPRRQPSSRMGEMMRRASPNPEIEQTDER